MFINREQAGKLLAKNLKRYQGTNSLVVGITRGGVIVAYEVAKALKLPLEIIVVKKVGAPDNPELAVGAVTLENTYVIDWDLAGRVGADKDYLEKTLKEKKYEVQLLYKNLRGKEMIDITGKNIILIDDGIATGATTEAAITYFKKKKCSKIILAVPVVASDTFIKLSNLVDDFIFLEKPEFFGAVGQFYKSFPQVTDEEVIKIIKTLKH